MNATITAAPLPENFMGTPQQLIEAFLDRLEVVVEGTSFVTGSTTPDGNQGPWLKTTPTGAQWWVWDPSTSEYAPLDVSASTSPQIYVGDISQGPPDPTQYQIWLQLNGSVFNGFFYYAGSILGWVTEPSVLTAGCITSSPVNMLAAGCVLTAAIGSGQVNQSKLAPNLPPSILAPGNPYQIIQTNSDGNAAGWVTLMSQSPNLAYATVMTWAHGLSEVPSIIRVVFICVADDTANGYSVDDEIEAIGNCGQPTGGSPGVRPGVTIYANATNIGVLGLDEYRLNQTGSTQVKLNTTTPLWMIKIYAAAA